MESSASPAAESKAMEVCLLILCFFMFARFDLVSLELLQFLKVNFFVIYRLILRNNRLKEMVALGLTLLPLVRK